MGCRVAWWKFPRRFGRNALSPSYGPKSKLDKQTSEQSACLLPAQLTFRPDDGGSTILRNAATHVSYYPAIHIKIQYSSQSPWGVGENIISQLNQEDTRWAKCLVHVSTIFPFQESNTSDRNALILYRSIIKNIMKERKKMLKLGMNLFAEYPSPFSHVAN